MASISNPKLLFLDEPTSSMDPISRKNINENIVVNKNSNNTIFYCTHIIDEAEFVSDRVGIMINGKLRVLGSAMEIKNRYGNEYMVWITFHNGDGQCHIKPFDDDNIEDDHDLDLLFTQVQIQDGNIDAKVQFNYTISKVKAID